jgi:hypothetical protein
MLGLDMDAAPSVEIVWTQSEGGERCIGESELRTQVQAALGQPTSVHPPEGPNEGTEKAFVRGSVGRGMLGRGWTAVIEVRRGDAASLRRELALDASDCRQLDEAIVLVTTLLLDASIPTPSPLRVTGHATPISVSIGPDVVVAWGMLPGLSYGIGLVSETEIRPLWPIVLSAHEWPVSRATQGGSGGDLGAATFGAALCPGILTKRVWGIFVCAGASGGEITSRGVGLDHPRGDVRPYVQIEAQVGVRLRIATFVTARLGLGAGVPLSQDSYQFRSDTGNLQTVFRTSDAVLGSQVAIELSTVP